jgi:hypothetical protein
MRSKSVAPPLPAMSKRPRSMRSVFPPRSPESAMRRMGAAIPLAIACALTSYASGANQAAYSVGNWSESVGNHGTRIRVIPNADAVWVHIPWRRRDAKPENKEIIVVDTAIGKRVANVLRVNINSRAVVKAARACSADGGGPEFGVFF